MVDTLPVVVCDGTGSPVAVLRTSDKGFHKSTEQGRLWVIDGETGRLLPMDGEPPLRSVVARDGFYLATLEGEADDDGSGAAGTENAGAGDADTGVAEAGDDESRGVLEQLRAARDGSSVPRPTGPTDSHPTDSGDAAGSSSGSPGDVLSRLQAVIAERQAAMPEGSYTTHLFQKGPDKIRKKTGEEAVELLLARTSDEIVSEAADLIYHLMVLLQASGLHIDTVLQRLAGRMDT